MDSPAPSTASIERDLDADISKIQSEIRTLQSHRHFLTSSLLNSSSLQSRLQHLRSSATDIDTDLSDITPLATAASKHNTTNHHRIAFTATTFPYEDHNPGLDNSNHNNNQNRLLGIRLDISGRNGRFSKPYYLLLKKVAAGSGEGGKRVRIHRHTIPGFISVRELERVFLPVPGRGEDVDGETDVLKPWKKQGARKQDLRGLVRELRKELVAWQLRRDVLELLRERLGFVREGEEVIDGGGELAERLGVVSLTAMGLDARYFRIQWADGRIGRLRISNTGAVMRAVVIKDSGRDKVTEVAMTGGDARVEGLLERLMGLVSSGN